MPNLINLTHAEVESDYNLEGFDVYDNAGNKLGDVDGVIADSDSYEIRYLVIDAGGWFSTKQFVVPAGDIQEIDENERRVFFRTLTKDTLESGRYPQYDDTWWDRNAHADFGQHEREIARAYQPADYVHGHQERESEPVDYSGDLYRRPAEGAQRLQLLEERLRVDKERYQAGEVRIGKRITERTESVSVPVREERVVIERTAGSGQVAGVGGEIREGETIEVPVMAEQVQVGKEAVVAEEVQVRKETVEHQERVQESVRREELAVDDPTGETGNGRDGETQSQPDPAARRR
jgi:uncharacterized protein (TIGR02271 family)